MAKITRSQFIYEQTQKAVEEYVSGQETADQVVTENGVDRGVPYRRRVKIQENGEGVHIDELESQGMTPQAAR